MSQEDEDDRAIDFLEAKRSKAVDKEERIDRKLLELYRERAHVAQELEANETPTDVCVDEIDAAINLADSQATERRKRRASQHRSSAQPATKQADPKTIDCALKDLLGHDGRRVSAAVKVLAVVTDGPEFKILVWDLSCLEAVNKPVDSTGFLKLLKPGVWLMEVPQSVGVVVGEVYTMKDVKVDILSTKRATLKWTSAASFLAKSTKGAMAASLEELRKPVGAI